MCAEPATLAKVAKDAIEQELTVQEMDAVAHINNLRSNLEFMGKLLKHNVPPSDTNLLVRPGMGEWALYHVYELNHAETVCTGTREYCESVKRSILERRNP